MLRYIIIIIYEVSTEREISIAPDRTLRRAYFERPFLTYSSQLAHPIVASRGGSYIKNNNR